MTFKFKSQATNEVLMLTAHAQALLSYLGKSSDARGILTPEEMPAALAALRALSTDEHLPEVATDKDHGQDHDDPKEVLVDLRHRAWPLIQMIETSLAANEPVVWGV